MKKMKTGRKRKIGQIVLAIIAVFVLGAILFTVRTIIGNEKADYDTDNYSSYLGRNMGDAAWEKIGLTEEIFPDSISADMKVDEFVAAQGTNIWGRRSLMFLKVEYSEEGYQAEKERLQKMNTEKKLEEARKKHYDQFAEPYELCAVESVLESGVVYALADGRQSIIYVEMISHDGGLSSKTGIHKTGKYMPKEYFPLDF